MSEHDIEDVDTDDEAVVLGYAPVHIDTPGPVPDSGYDPAAWTEPMVVWRRPTVPVWPTRDGMNFDEQALRSVQGGRVIESVIRFLQGFTWWQTWLLLAGAVAVNVLLLL